MIFNQHIPFTLINISFILGNSESIIINSYMLIRLNTCELILYQCNVI